MSSSSEIQEERPNRPTTFITIAAILAAGAVGFILLRALAPQPQAEPPAVRVPLVSSAPINFREGSFTIEGSGRVNPVAEVSIEAQVSGNIVEVSPNFRAGERVAENETLFRIEREPYEARLGELRAQLASAEADAALRRAQASRTDRLFEMDAASAEEVDQARATAAAAEATIRQLQASIRSANLDLQRTVVRSPFDAAVLEETVSLGSVVAPGVRVGTIYDVTEFEITVALAEDEARLVPGLFSIDTQQLPVRVIAEFGGDLFSWSANATRIEPGVDLETRTIDLVVTVEDPSRQGTPLSGTPANEAPPLLQGMFTTVELPTRTYTNLAQIPREALRQDDMVWVVVPNSDNRGTIEVLKVRSVYEQSGVAFVTSDVQLADAARVLIRPPGRVLPGMEIEVDIPAASDGRTDIADAQAAQGVRR